MLILGADVPQLGTWITSWSRCVDGRLNDKGKRGINSGASLLICVEGRNCMECSNVFGLPRSSVVSVDLNLDRNDGDKFSENCLSSIVKTYRSGLAFNAHHVFATLIL